MNREEMDRLRGLAEAAKWHEKLAFTEEFTPHAVLRLLDEIARLETGNEVLRRALELVDEGDDTNVAEECLEIARAIIEQEEGNE